MKNATKVPWERQPKVVGIVSTEAGARMLIQRVGAPTFDLIEVRLDALKLGASTLSELLFVCRKHGLPVLLTARRPDEGGEGNLSLAERVARIRSCEKFASYVDVELRSLVERPEWAAEIKERGIELVVSSHDFEKTPSLEELREQAQAAEAAGADIFKCATMVRSMRDLIVLTDFLTTSRIPVSVMGMGYLGGVSRALLGQLGSVLNYGWIDAPNVPGQWSARLLKECFMNVRDNI